MRVIMQFDENRRKVGEFAAARASAYCAIWGDSFVCRQTVSTGEPYRVKLEAIRDALDECVEDVLWLDADALILDPTRSLAPLRSVKPVTLSQDNHGPCTGVMYFRRDQWAPCLLDTWILLGLLKDPSVFGGDQREQATLKLLMQNFNNVSDNIALMDRDVVADQEYVGVKPFIHHFWATNKDQDIVLERMKAYGNTPTAPVNSAHA